MSIVPVKVKFMNNNRGDDVLLSFELSIIEVVT